ncbi:MAG: KGK domain-containing protein [Cyanobacteria bacterium P01_G01_bin.54]
MTSSPPFPPYHDDDVIAFGDSIFKVSTFRRAVQGCFGHDVGYGLMTLLENQGVKIDKAMISPDGDKATFGDWFDQGIPCELLKVDATGWHKVKARIKVDIELEPAELEPVELEPVEPDPLPALPAKPDLDIDEADATLHADMWRDGAALVDSQ